MNELSRRLFVRRAVGLASTLQMQRAARALGFAPASDVCTLEAEQEVGPYYVANEMIRHDIRESKAGFPLALNLIVLDSRTCKPLPHAAIDVWHCDALGLYAGYTKNNPMGGDGPGGPGGFGGPGGPPPGFDPERPGPPPGDHGPGSPPPDGMGGMQGPPPSDKLTFLRGIQFTDAQGRVSFQTVFPGFYPGRTNHIHFKVRLGGHTGLADAHRTYLAGHTSHIGQVFFPEEARRS